MLHLLQSTSLRWLSVLGAGVIFTLGAWSRHYKLAVVVGESMLPTLRPGDVLIVDRQAYRRLQPDRGDVVVARYGTDWVVKRIVGLPGEEVEVKRGGLFIDGVEQPENYSVAPGLMEVAKGRLLEGDYATLGDNRSVPAVLAIHPILLRQEVLGKVIYSFSVRSFATNP
jgi:signal peptidase I